MITVDHFDLWDYLQACYESVMILEAAEAKFQKSIPL
jgi:hypothetical protein